MQFECTMAGEILGSRLGGTQDDFRRTIRRAKSDTLRAARPQRRKPSSFENIPVEHNDPSYGTLVGGVLAEK